jgi:sialate O-acetylesterase
LSRSAALALFVCAPFVAAQEVTIQGVVSRQVLQRDADEHATLKITGSAPARANNRFVEGRITQKDAPLPGLDWTPLGKVQRGAWSGDFRIPTGGPYKLEVRVAGLAGTVAVDEILVGDLWVLAGQSNMEGVGDLVDVQPPFPLINSFDLTDRWVEAREPLHLLVNAVDPVHWRKNAAGQPERLSGAALDEFIANRKKGAGLGLPFAAEMVRRTGVPIGLVPCAHGGTSMDQWDPKLKAKGGESLYGSMFRRIQAVGGRIKGVLWYQGESDANPKAAPEFGAKFQAFVAALRADVGDPKLPFYYVQIGRHVNAQNVAEWNRVQEAQRLAEAAIPGVGMVSAVDLALDDSIHISTPDLKRLGRRLANLATRDLFPSIKEYAQMKRGPRPVSAKLANNTIKLQLSEINGSLVAEGRISGFSLTGVDGVPVPAIYRARLDPADPAAILLDVHGKLPEKPMLWYGQGKDPYCNLRDIADMALPMFGPLAITQ